MRTRMQVSVAARPGPLHWQPRCSAAEPSYRRGRRDMICAFFAYICKHVHNCAIYARMKRIGEICTNMYWLPATGTVTDSGPVVEPGPGSTDDPYCRQMGNIFCLMVIIGMPKKNVL